jgi:medium-chain acyl-[acyl-carrier-protein] hydrolase
MKYIQHLRVKSYHINRFGEVSTPYLFWYMQEIAWEHALTLGFGFEHLRADQLFWVLSRFRVHINRRPKWKEEFDLETWARGTDGFFAYRDYRFVNGSGEVMLTATSTWLVLNLETKKIQRLGDHNNFLPYQKSEFGTDAGKVEAPDYAGQLEFFPVLFNEIDFNQHFNSGRYLERINNIYSFDFHAKHSLAEMEVNFLKEGMPSDLLAVKKQEINPLDHLCSIERQSDKADLIRARLVWEEKK